MADARRLEQVLVNMVANAVKYTPAGGTIRTTVSQENGSIKFAVSDNGRGIPKEDLERVFEPFYRVPHQPTDGRRAPGWGWPWPSLWWNCMGGRFGWKVNHKKAAPSTSLYL